VEKCTFGVADIVSVCENLALK